MRSIRNKYSAEFKAKDVLEALGELYREIGKLKVELDGILKKTSNIF